MIGFGTIINTAAIIIGGMIGHFIGKLFKQEQQAALNKACGISVIFIAIAGAMQGMIHIDAGTIVSGKSMVILNDLFLVILAGKYICPRVYVAVLSVIELLFPHKFLYPCLIHRSTDKIKRYGCLLIRERHEYPAAAFSTQRQRQVGCERRKRGCVHNRTEVREIVLEQKPRIWHGAFDDIFPHAYLREHQKR